MKYKAFFLTLITIASTPTFGDLSSCCNECWTADVEWIYWKLRDFDFTETRGDEQINSTSGVRIGIFNDCGCWDYGARYTHHIGHIGDSDTDPDPSLNQVQLEAGYTWGYNCCAYLRSFGGFSYEQFDFRECDVNQGNEDQRIGWKMSGYGAYAGLGGGLPMVCDFFLVGDFSLGLGYADANVKSGAMRHGTKTPCNSLLGNTHISLGLSRCFHCCWEVNLSFGYEFNIWYCSMGPASIFRNFNQQIQGGPVQTGVIEYDGYYLKAAFTF